jgi:hypothetical protein
MVRRLYLPMVWVVLFDVAALALVAGLLRVWLG